MNGMRSETDDFDAVLRRRLSRLESAIDAGDLPDLQGRRLHFGRSMGLLAVVAAMLLATGGGAVIGARVLAPNEPTGHEGLSNRGQPLHCSGIEQMTPREADGLLRQRGYTVTWQIEERPSGRFWFSDVPPDTGYPIGGVLIDGHITYVVEVGAAAQPVPPQQCWPWD